MSKQNEAIIPRTYMEMAVEVMIGSIRSPNANREGPMVGAVLVKADGTVQTAYRGELRKDEHAEFTLLERKNQSSVLDGAVLFTTVGPCVQHAPNSNTDIGCAQRIVNARIKKVWIGIEDTGPPGDKSGISYLIENGVEIEMFDADLQTLIRNLNKQYLLPPTALPATATAQTNANTSVHDFSVPEVQKFISSAQLNVEFSTLAFKKIFSQMGLVEYQNNQWIPTRLGFLLFGSNPQRLYQNALIRASFKTSDKANQIATIAGPLTGQPDKIMAWYVERLRVSGLKDNNDTDFDFPLQAIKETIVNAIVHRDYDIEGAPIYFEMSDEYIIIKSPGMPLEPLQLEQIEAFNAPSLCRNPKIMYVFDQLNLVRQRGHGFQTIRELPVLFDLPTPKVSYQAPYLIITFQRNYKTTKAVKMKPSRFARRFPR